jgi:hypothetical protein
MFTPAWNKATCWPHEDLHTYKRTHIQTYRRFPQRTSVSSGLHTFTPSHRRTGSSQKSALRRGRGVLSLSHFLTGQKTRRKKPTRLPRSGGRLRSVAERRGTCDRRSLRQHVVRIARSLRRLLRRTAQGREKRMGVGVVPTRGDRCGVLTKDTASTTLRSMLRSNVHTFTRSNSIRAAQGRGALHDDPDCSAIARISSRDRRTGLPANPAPKPHTPSPSPPFPALCSSSH